MLAAFAAMALGAAPASARVVSLLQDIGNGQYEATLRDTDLVDWEGADLQISYADAAFSFVSGTVGDLDPLNFSVAFGTPQVDAAGQVTLLAGISHGLADVANGNAVVLRLLFDARAGAVPGARIGFATADPSIYYFLPTAAAIGGPTSVPEGNSAWLAAAALAALWASRRFSLR